jgi:hypothetical protein
VLASIDAAIDLTDAMDELITVQDGSPGSLTDAAPGLIPNGPGYPLLRNRRGELPSELEQLLPTGPIAQGS